MKLMKGRESKDPTSNLKGFIAICSCNRPDKEHIDGNVECPVERLMIILEKTGGLRYVFDIIDVKAIAMMNPEAEDVRHDEVTE